MTSKLRSLLSQGSTPRASEETDPGSPFSRGFSATTSGLSMSPSFSDFSMGISPAEAEKELSHSGVRSCQSVPVSPLAFDGRPPAPAPRLSLDAFRGAKGIWGTLAGAPSVNAPPSQQPSRAHCRTN